MESDLQDMLDQQVKAAWRECYAVSQLLARHRDKDLRMKPEVAFYLGCVQAVFGMHITQHEKDAVSAVYRRPQDLEPAKDEELVILNAPGGKVFAHMDATGMCMLGVCPSRDPNEWQGLSIVLTEHQRQRLVEFLGYQPT